MCENKYPNPQFRRDGFVDLSGEWEFEMGNGQEYKQYSSAKLLEKIQVPYCPESQLSGINFTDFITSCRYRRFFSIAENQTFCNTKLFFGAVDYEATVYVNGKMVGEHRGGYTSFSFDITWAIKAGENELLVIVRDNINDNVPSGKQSPKKESFGCFYTRCTGIWQPVWLEFMPKNHIKNVKFFPNIKDSAVVIEAIVEGEGSLQIDIFYKGNRVGGNVVEFFHKKKVTCELSESHLWEAGVGDLYDVTLSYCGDVVKSYFGLRSAEYSGYKFLLNGKNIYQRFVLNQGYYKKGVYTPENNEEILRDISITKALGFNGMRLHQKLFSKQYLYACDKAGMMVWGEFASWGVDFTNLDALGNYIAEWREAIEQDFNHPSIITWCPLNEVWADLWESRKIRDVRFVESVYAVTKIIDPTRPCVDTSGGFHGRHTDVFDFHCYFEPERLEKHIDDLEKSLKFTMDNTFAPSQAQENIPYSGQAITASEYGGVAYAANGTGWGYHNSYSEEDFVDIYVRLTNRLLNCGKLCGFCYTQLYDVEQEQNGLYTYEREPKFSQKAMDRIAECNKQVAQIEKM